MQKRILSILLVICMVISMVPVTALAEEVTEELEVIAEVTKEETAEVTDTVTEEVLEEVTEEVTEEEVTEEVAEEEVTEEATVPETTEAVVETEPEPVCTCESDDPAFHATNCPCYEAPENPQCFCAEKCSEPNVWCDICGFDSSRCGGEDTAVTYDGPCTHSVEAELSFVSGSSNTKDNEAEEYLLDGDPSTKWCGDFGDGFENYVIFTADGASVLTSYTLTTGADTGSDFRHYRNWKAWTLYGSNSPDGDWTVIDEVTGAVLPMASNAVSDPFLVDPHTPYTYYKLEVNAVFGKGTPPSQQMADITIQKLSYPNGECDKCGEACPHGVWEDGNCVLCGTTCSHSNWQSGKCNTCGTPCSHGNWQSGKCNTCGTVCAHSEWEYSEGNSECIVCGTPCAHENWQSGKCNTCGILCPHSEWEYSAEKSECTACGTLCSHRNKLALHHVESSDSYDGQTANNLFDNYYAYKWRSVFGESETYVIFTANEDAVLRTYTLVTADDTYQNLGSNWKAWTISGSDNIDGPWNEIQQVHSASLPTWNWQRQDFVVAAHTPYRYFKLVVTAVESGTTQQMAELEAIGSWFVNGKCTLCKLTCETHAYQDGICKVCGFAHNHQFDNNNKCNGCGYTCTHNQYNENNKCVLCGAACTHADFKDSVCKDCGYECDHTTAGYEAGFCKLCGTEHDHDNEGYKDGAREECGYPCPHIQYNTERNCVACGTACTHKEFNGTTCADCGYVCDHTVGYNAGFCKLCGTEHNHTGEGYTNGVHTFCGYPCPHGTVLQLTHVSGTGAIAGDTFDKLFDNNSDSKWCANFGGSETYVIFKAEAATVLKSYTLTTGNDTFEYPGRNWKDWTLYGSNSADGPWTQIQKVRSANLPEANSTSSQPIAVPKHAPYTHFKLVVNSIEGGTIQQMSELTASDSCIVNGVCTICNFGCNTHDYADGFCKVCGAVCTHNFNNGVCTVCGYSCPHEEILNLALIDGSNDNAGNLLDRNPATMWDHTFGGDGANWIEFKAGETAAVIKSYTLTTHDQAGAEGDINWNDWTLYGKNASEDWTEIHRITDAELPWINNFTTAPYVLVNPMPYSQFRLVVNDTQWSDVNKAQRMADITVTGSYMRSGVCGECGYKCQNHVYSNGICKICSYVCLHTSFTKGDCDTCDYICPHANFGTDCKCTVCKIECSHERGYTDGICITCKTACGHQNGYNDNGFCNACKYYEPAPLENGVYKISNAGQLYWFAQQVGQGNTGINGELTCDIDLKANSPTSGNWGSLGSEGQPYQGTLDGKGYTVDNVKTWEDRYVGFIRAIGTNGVVRNLGLGQQCSISGYDITGGICGKNEGLIEGCWYRGYLEGRGVANNSTYIGGIAGGIAGENKGTIKNCWFDGLMNESGPDGYYPCDNGGIVGDNTGGLVENCYNVGTLFGWQTYGGIAGSGGTVKNCYAHMPIKKASNTSECEDPQGIGYCTVRNSYYESPSVHESGETHGIPRSAFSTGELAYKLQQGTNSTELIWGQNLDNGKPRDDHPIQAYHGAPRVYEVKDCQGNTYYSNSSSDGSHRFGSDGKCPCGAQCPHESTACMDQGNGSHNHVCTLCGYVTATESHTFDPVTELCVCGAKCGHNFENGICTLCGKTNAPIVITQQPTNGEAKLGERYCVEVIAVGEGLQYQWYMKNAGSKSFAKSSVTDNTYDDVMTTARAGREVYCVITDAHGNKVTTDTVKLICVPGEDLAITKQPNDSSAKLGEKYCVTVEAKGDGLKYKWYWRNKGTENWNASGVTDNTYDDLMTSARHNREVKCVISDAWGNKVETEIATITGIPTVTLAITRQPESQTVKLGENFNVTFDAVGDGLKYQWYFQNAGTETWYTSGQKDNSYDDVMTEARHNRKLYCVVTDAWGNQVETNPIVTIMASVKDELAITKQPNHDSAKLGEMFCVTVEAQGDSLKYKWYWRNVGNERWNASGQRDNTYDDVMTKERNNREVKCVITDMWGNEIESDIAIITGIPTVALEITSQPTDSNVAKGERYCVTVEAQGDGLTYAWYFKNAGTATWYKSGVTDNTYDDVMTTARAGREVYCVVTDALGNSITTDHAIIGIQ